MQECSILLNCTRQEVEDALARALQHLATGEIDHPARVSGDRRKSRLGLFFGTYPRLLTSI